MVLVIVIVMAERVIVTAIAILVIAIAIPTVIIAIDLFDVINPYCYEKN